MRMFLFCLLLSIVPAAHALVITQTLTRTGQTSDQGPSGEFGGSFQQFDPALGQLIAVDLSFVGNITYSVNYQLDPPHCIGGCYSDVWFGTGYIFNAPGFPHSIETSSDFFASVYWGQLVSFDPVSGLYRYRKPGDSSSSHAWYSPDLLSGSSSGAIYFSGNPDNFAGYLGTGNVMIDGGISEDSDVCWNNGIKPRCSDNLYLTTTLRYVYTSSVAEPSELLIFAVGLTCLGWLGARAKRI